MINNQDNLASKGYWFNAMGERKALTDLTVPHLVHALAKLKESRDRFAHYGHYWVVQEQLTKFDHKIEELENELASRDALHRTAVRLYGANFQEKYDREMIFSMLRETPHPRVKRKRARKIKTRARKGRKARK